MRRFLTILIIVVSVSGCKKNDGPKNSGTVTISNQLYGMDVSMPYALGFSVVTGKKVSTLNNPLDVISILVDADGNNKVRRLMFSTENLDNSFFRYGQYGSAAGASAAFTSLKTFSEPSWKGTGDTIRPNQVWLYRTSDFRFAKLRIIDTLTMTKTDMPFPFGQCTFEWVFQPDGSLTFPGK